MRESASMINSEDWYYLSICLETKNKNKRRTSEWLAELKPEFPKYESVVPATHTSF
jgi:hypothetical protein